MIRRVEAGRTGPLVAAAVYVIAVAALLSGRTGVPEPLQTSLAIRQWAFLARVFPPPGPASSGLPIGFANLRESLADLARRTPFTDRDRLRAAAVAASAGARELVGLFAGPIAARDAAAHLFCEWAFDPHPRLQRTDLEALETSALDEHLKDLALAAIAQDAGLSDLASSAQARIEERRASLLAAGSGVAIAAVLVLILGSVFWYRLRRGLPPEAPALPFSREAALPIVRVFIYFMAVFLTANVLLPMVLASLWPTLGVGVLVVWTYAVVGTAGLWLVHAVGRGGTRATFAELIGLRGSFQPARVRVSLAWAARAYCLLWPATIATGIVWTSLVGDGAGAFDNPMATLLATEPDVALLLFAVAVLAPLFEEPLFRGYVYGRLRAQMNPIPAAALSGLLFAAAHLSLSNLLPLAAIGFTLALAYERSRDLATPIVAHGLWNLVEALAIVAVFR